MTENSQPQTTMKHLLTIAALIMTSQAWSASAQQPLEADYADKVVPFLKQHCISCHGAEKQEGEVRFDGPMPDLVDTKQSERWLAAKRMMAQGEMPPKGKLRPTVDELTRVLAWIDDAAARAATITRGGIGRRALRRLTPREYVSTAMDVLGLSFPHFAPDLSKRLPGDTAADGFSNDSNQQTTQPLLLRRSLDLAEQLVDVALPEEPHSSPVRYEVDLCEFVAKVTAKTSKPATIFAAYSLDVPAAGEEKPASLSVVGRWSGPNNDRRPKADTRLDAKRGIRLAPNPVLIGNPHECLTLRLPLVPDRGVLRLRVKAGASIPTGETTPVLRLSIAREYTIVPVGEIAVTAPADAPEEYVIEAPLALVDADWKGIRRDGRVELQIDNAAALVAPTLREPNEKRKEQQIPLPARNELIVSALAVEVVAAPSQSLDWLASAKNGETERDRARRSLQRFLSRAFRRPASESEVHAYLGLFDAERARGASFVAASKASLTAALISPQFFYLIEPKDTEQRPLTAWELASRLSYLAWGTSPDEELRTRAEDGSLVREDELRRQLARLLSDPRSYAFCREFARQWLDLDSVLHLDKATILDRLTINQKEDIPWYEAILRRDLVEESPRLFEELLRKNRPVESLVDCEFVVINDRLARFYGIDGVSGHPFRAVPAPADRRGGLVTQAGCVAAGSHGRERSEILRGVYLVERILGIDIPTPPGNVQPLDVQLNIDKNLRRLPPREHVEAHSSVNTCAVCHQRIDPLGFVWDQYDMFGRLRRDKEGKLAAAKTDGKLPDKTPFADIDEFRKRLIEPLADASPTPRFTDAFSRRLYAYVLGRSLDHGDEAHLKSIHAAAKKVEGGLRDLLTAMVLSKPFREK